MGGNSGRDFKYECGKFQVLGDCGDSIKCQDSVRCRREEEQNEFIVASNYSTTEEYYF